MKLLKKQAFTLVELIVVITILAILGTVAFISLQGYTREARDSKRLSDINNIQKKIGIEIVKGTSLSSLINLVKTNSGLTIDGNNTARSIQGTANFQALKEDGSKFKDPITGGDYVVSYSLGGTGTGAYKFTQVSTVNEENNQAVVNGNYYQMKSGDSIGIIKNNSDSFVINEGSNLPYEPVVGGGGGSGPVYSCDDTSKPADNGHITYVGTPTAVNQVYIKDQSGLSSCSFSCSEGFGGADCNTPTDPYFADVTFLMKFEGIDGGTTFTDIKGHTFEKVGLSTTAGVTDTDRKVFGNSSYATQGSVSYIRTTTSTNAMAFNATEDFTVELFYFPNSDCWGCQLVVTATDGGIQFGSNNFGTYKVSYGATWSYPAINQWSHIAVTRTSGTLRVFVNGILKKNEPNTTVYPSGILQFSWAVYGTGDIGNIDNFRVTKGFSRYNTGSVIDTQYFTPPTEDFPEA